jgi:hypothetical protein
MPVQRQARSPVRVNLHRVHDVDASIGAWDAECLEGGAHPRN